MVFVGEPSAAALPPAKAVADKVLKLYFEPERGILRAKVKSTLVRLHKALQ